MPHTHPDEIAQYTTGSALALANGRTIDLADLSTIGPALDVACWVRGMCCLARWRGQTPQIWHVSQHSPLVTRIALELYRREVPRAEWCAADIWAIAWCGEFHDCEEALTGDPPAGLGVVPGLGPALKAYKRAVRAEVAAALARLLGVDPCPLDGWQGGADHEQWLWGFVHRADKVYAIDLERRAHSSVPEDCVTLNDAPPLQFKLDPEHAGVLSEIRVQVAPWCLPFELACHTLTSHLEEMARAWDAAHMRESWRTFPERLMDQLIESLELVFTASAEDSATATFRRADGSGEVWAGMPGNGGPVVYYR